MRRFTLLAALLVAMLQPPPAGAHGAGIPWIYVEEEQVWPGEPFHVLILDVAPFVTVSLRAENGDTSAALGVVPTGPQGHGEADVSLPADFPDGYAELRGIGDDGSQVTATLRVGDVPDLGLPVGPQPQPQASPASVLADPSLWTLVLIVGGALLAVAWMALRRRRALIPASVESIAPAARTARQSAARKRSSRRRR